MALLSEASKEKEFDVRMINRGLSKGLITQDEVEKHKKSLSDDAETADYIDLEVLLESVKGKSGLR